MIRYITLFLVSFSFQAAAANFTIAATPTIFSLPRGSSVQVQVSQTTQGFAGLVTYSVFTFSHDLSYTLSTVGNTATVTISTPTTTAVGTEYVIVEGTSSGSSSFVLLSANITNPPPPPPPPAAPRVTGGAITISSVGSSTAQSLNFTTLGTADWFSLGNYGGMCGPGPCYGARKTGGTGLVGAINSGGGDTWFYPYTPNFASVIWSDSNSQPNGSAVHVNNSAITFQAFAGVETRTLTVVAGLSGSGSFTTSLHVTDGQTADVVDTQVFSTSGVRAFTIKYNAAAAGHQLVVTMTRGGGELLFYGAALSASPTPETHNMTLTDNIQAFVQAVAPGDTLLLPDGYRYVGHLVLPARLASGWVDIKSNTSVAAGTRVTPTDLKVAFVTPDELPAVQNDFNNADHSLRAARGWRLTGIEITGSNPQYTTNYNLISFGFGSNPVLSDISSDITLDRCYIHGDGSINYIRGVLGNANNISVTNSYLSAFLSASAETNAINVFSSAGPVNIINNYLEATGENIMIGGSGPDIGPALIPTRGLIQHNYFLKQPSWRGGPYIVKNLLEFKDGYNFTIDSNVFENNWLAAQSGFALLITPRTFGGTIANHVDTLTYTNNIIAHVGSGITIGIYDDLATDANGNSIPPSQLQQVHDITLRNNLFDDLSLKYAQYSHGMLIFGPPNNLVVDHNTYNFGEQTDDHGWWLANNTGVTPSNASITGNDFGADLYGDSRGPTAAMFTGGTFTGNNIRNATTNWYSTPYAANNTFNITAPTGVGADVAGLTSREAAIKSGNR